MTCLRVLQEYIETPNHVVLMFEIMEGGDLLSYLKQEYASWERLVGHLGSSDMTTERDDLHNNMPNNRPPVRDKQHRCSSGHHFMALLDEHSARVIFSQVSDRVCVCVYVCLREPSVACSHSCRSDREYTILILNSLNACLFSM